MADFGAQIKEAVDRFAETTYTSPGEQHRVRASVAITDLEAEFKNVRQHYVSGSRALKAIDDAADALHDLVASLYFANHAPEERFLSDEEDLELGGHLNRITRAMDPLSNAAAGFRKLAKDHENNKALSTELAAYARLANELYKNANAMRITFLKILRGGISTQNR